ncbi:MAG: hypothetical protein CK424_02585 [Legionella sp.]|nr:MAG: hypothetical protein CK424_02585 [Legionella sp.]
MEIQLESQEQHAVRSYGPHSITIGSETIQNSCVICKEFIHKEWPIQSITALTTDDLAPLIQSKPEVIILGHDSNHWPSPAIASYLSTQKIGLECMSIGAACRTFNILLGEKRAVALGIILTASKDK